MLSVAPLALLAHLSLRARSRVRPVRLKGVLRAFSRSSGVLLGESECSFVAIPFAADRIRCARSTSANASETSRSRRTFALAFDALRSASNSARTPSNFRAATTRSLSAFSFSASAFCVSARDLKSSARRLSMSLKASSSGILTPPTSRTLKVYQSIYKYMLVYTGYTVIYLYIQVYTNIMIHIQTYTVT